MRNSVPKKEITIAEYSSIDDSQKIRQLQLTGYDYGGRQYSSLLRKRDARENSNEQG